MSTKLKLSSIAATLAMAGVALFNTPWHAGDETSTAIAATASTPSLAQQISASADIAR